jgi:uncharacterized protein YecE (DUF72 family)
VIRIDTSGWSDDHWVGVLLESGHRMSARLAGYVHAFDTVELNASFYRWPKDSTLAGFRRLKSPEPWVERFERCRRLLGDRAEMLRVQLHP